MVRVKFKKLHPDAVIPLQKYPTDGACDVVATSHKYDDWLHTYGLGFAVEIPNGYRLRIVPRSSFTKTSCVMQNADAIVDSSYRGEIIIKFRELELFPGDAPYSVGDRIAQCYLESIIPIEWEEVDELSETVRNTGGFGSTGN